MNTEKNEIRLKLSSYDHRLLDDVVKKITFQLKSDNFTFTGPIPLPTKREIFSFPRSPHVDKPSIEQFQRLTHKRLIIVNGDKAVVSSIDRVNIPAGVLLEIKN